jgi:hypothetical protein
MGVIPIAGKGEFFGRSGQPVMNPDAWINIPRFANRRL